MAGFHCTVEIRRGHEEGCCPGMGLSSNRPAPTKGIADYPKNTLRASSSIMAREVRSEGTREQAAKPQAAQERESFLFPPFAIVSPLAWLLATPPNGELARRLEKMTKARQIPGGVGGRTASHYDISSRAFEFLRLSKISDDFPKTPKCPQISVPKTFEHFRSYFRWFLSKRT